MSKYATDSWELDALDPAFPNRIEGGFSTRLHLQLGEDVSQVDLHRVDADEELPGDLLITGPGSYQSKDFQFAFGKALSLVSHGDLTPQSSILSHKTRLKSN